MRPSLAIPEVDYRIDFEIEAGRFLVKVLHKPEDIRNAFLLRYQVFQIEMIGLRFDPHQEDRDTFDELANHLAIFDKVTHQMIATCRLIDSNFSNRFYSEQEFQCGSFFSRDEIKLEIGRVCVHPLFRRSIVIMLLWRGIAEYMVRAKSQILFGCGSISTLDPLDAAILYRHLVSEGKLTSKRMIEPTLRYRSEEFDKLLLKGADKPLSTLEKSRAVKLIPPLCKSYFDIGCTIGGPPAFDQEFKCIDFFTVLEVSNLSERVRKRMFGDQR